MLYLIREKKINITLIVFSGLHDSDFAALYFHFPIFCGFYYTRTDSKEYGKHSVVCGREKK